MEINDEVETLLKKYDGIIKKIVNRYKVSNFDKEDLYQAGQIGLFKAIKKFNSCFNVKLSTYAFKYIIGEVNKEYKKLNLYGNVEYNKIRNYIFSHSNKTPEEICIDLNINKETFYDAVSRVDQVTYLEDEVRDQIIDKKVELEVDLNNEEYILYQYYIVRNLTQSEIAKLLNVSQSTVSRSISRLKKKLKDNL